MCSLLIYWDPYSECDVDFAIDLGLDTKPISISPYLMAPAKLKELSVQSSGHLDKGIIRSSVSLWGAPILFGKKEGRGPTYAH